MGKRITSLRIERVRSLAGISAKIADYTTLIGRNDPGKSSFLRALELLFDASSTPTEDDRCRMAGGSGPCYVEATLAGCEDAEDLARDGEIRLRRQLGARPFN